MSNDTAAFYPHDCTLAEGRHTVILDLIEPFPDDFPHETQHWSASEEVLLRALLDDDDTLHEAVILLARTHGRRTAHSVTLIRDTTCTLPTGPLQSGGLHLGTVHESWAEGPDGFSFDQRLYEEPGVISIWLDTQFWDQGTYDHDNALLQTFEKLTPIGQALDTLELDENPETLHLALQAAHTMGVTEVECVFALKDHGVSAALGEVEGRQGALFLGTFPLD